MREYIRRNLGQFSVFLAVGLTTAGLYFSALFIFTEVFKLPPLLAFSISFAMATIWQFLVNFFVTFRKKNDLMGMSRSALRFFILLAVSYGFQMAIISFALRVWSLDVYGASVIAICLNTGMSYIVSKYWVYSKNDESTG